MEEKRDSMIFYRSFYEAIKELSKEQQGEIYNAIFSYGLDFYEPELKGISKTVWTLIKPQIDANIRRYNNGKKEKNKLNESKTEAKQKQEVSKTEANVNVNVNVNEKDINKADKIDFDALILFINKTFGRSFKKVSIQVKAKYNARLKDGYTKEDFLTAIINCSKLQFHIDNNFQYCTPEYFSRAEILDKYSSTTIQENKKEPEFDLYTDSVKKAVAIAKSFEQ